METSANQCTAFLYDKDIRHEIVKTFRDDLGPCQTSAMELFFFFFCKKAPL